MPTIIIPWRVSGLATVYVVMERLADNFLLGNLDGTFEAAPAAFPYLTESTTRYQDYEGIITTLDDGLYQLSAYVRQGAAQDRQVDLRIWSQRKRYTGNVDEDDTSLAEVKADLATIATYIDTEITTLLSRIGAFTGTGVNTVLGFFKALLKKDAAIPSDIGGTFDSSTDSTEAISERLNAVGGLTGQHQVTLQYYETATVIPIADVIVDVYDSTNTSRMNGSSLLTASTGQSSFSRNNGVYKIRGMKAGVTIALGTVTVADGDVTQILYGTPITFAAPGGADTCTVWLECFLPNSTTPMTVDKAKGKAKIVNLPFAVSGRFHSGQEITGTYDVNTGIMQWVFPYGASVEVSIPNVLRKVETVTVPSTGGSVNLEDLL